MKKNTVLKIVACVLVLTVLTVAVNSVEASPLIGSTTSIAATTASINTISKYVPYLNYVLLAWTVIDAVRTVINDTP